MAGYPYFAKIQNLSRGKTVHLIFGVWSNCRSRISFSSIIAKHRTFRGEKKKSFLTQSSIWIGSRKKKKKKNCSVLFSVISRSFLVRLKTCWFLLIQSSGETCLKFHFTMWFFQRLKFPFKYKILYLQICIYKYKSCHLSSDIFFRGLQRLIQLVHGIKNVCLECWFL